MSAEENPQDRFRELPDPPRPEDLVETSDASGPTPPEREVRPAWQQTLLGGGAG